MRKLCIPNDIITDTNISSLEFVLLLNLIHTISESEEALLHTGIVRNAISVDLRTLKKAIGNLISNGYILNEIDFGMGKSTIVHLNDEKITRHGIGIPGNSLKKLAYDDFTSVRMMYFYKLMKGKGLTIDNVTRDLNLSKKTVIKHNKVLVGRGLLTIGKNVLNANGKLYEVV